MCDAAMSDERKNPDRAERLETSPAFDQWLDRRVKLLLRAAESAPDPRTIEVIQHSRRKSGAEVTD